MIPRRPGGAGIIAGVLLAGWLGYSGWSLHRGLEKEAHAAARRIKEPIEVLIQKAYRNKDDLAVQETIQALAHAPGISLACVRDKDDKVLAHNRISQIGKPFRYSRAVQDLYSFPLRAGQTQWGTLVFTMSSRAQRDLWVRQCLKESLALFVMYLGFIVWSLVLEKRLSRLRNDVSERDALLAQENAESLRLQERLRQAQECQAVWARTAVNQIADGLLLLDQRQRVVAANAAAVRLLGVADEAALRGKPWSEVPFLQSCGALLEESLQSSMTELHSSGPAGAPVLSLMTLPEGSGTWVKLFPSKHVVE